MSEDHAPKENHHTDETAHEEVAATTPPKSAFPPAIALAFVIIALLGMVIVMVLKNGKLVSNVAPENLKELQAEVDARRAELNRQRASMGLSPIEGGSETMGEVANRLKDDADALVVLAKKFEGLIAEKDVELTARNAELIRSETTRKALSEDNARLKAELQRALVNGSDADLLRRDLADLRSQREALSAELAELRKKGGVSSDDYAELKRRFDETLRAKEFFEARVKELEGDLSKAKLFASSESELLPAAVELFRNLRLLEGKSDSDISTSYSSLGVQLGANVLHTLTFATGSSTLTPADEDVIGRLVSDLPDGDLLFVVGYASETGNVDSNQKLSSDRATAAATFYSGVKRPGQLVQAVYLGQTDRFSSRIPERNQLVEIWRIRKK
ncbi:MAG: hypothetical protein EOP88_23055 [Verrucomicrobiaceae bacterium]|nr:MAG: hypothetical protein EOP88_23055 [Verrucomicrobiaceae bacterium]